MLSRTSHVKQINVTSLIFSSSVQIGDTRFLDVAAQALAVQEVSKCFSGDPELFQDYEVFNYRTPLPIIFENVSMTRTNKKSTIQVGVIDAIGVSSSSTLAVGNIDHTRLSSRILNIRRLAERGESMKGG